MIVSLEIKSHEHRNHFYMVRFNHCRYPEESFPERYIMFNVQGLPNRIQVKGVHSAWAAAANIGNHKTLTAPAGLMMIKQTIRIFIINPSTANFNGD